MVGHRLLKSPRKQSICRGSMRQRPDSSESRPMCLYVVVSEIVDVIDVARLFRIHCALHLGSRLRYRGRMGCHYSIHARPILRVQIVRLGDQFPSPFARNVYLLQFLVCPFHLPMCNVC